MANISKVQVGNTTYNIKDAAAVHSISTGTTNGTISVNNNGTSTDVAIKGLGTAAYTSSSDYVKPNHLNTYYVKGTQTAATGTWTGNLPEVDALYNGLTIDYWLPFGGSGNATLNLTLKGGTKTGAKNCYTGGTTRLTTQIGANAIVRLIYQTVTISGTSYSGWWMVRSQDNNDLAYNIRNGSSAYQANSAIYRYQLLFQVDDNKLTPLNNADNDLGTSKAMLTGVDFLPFGKIFYYNSTSNIAANASMTTMLYSRFNFDLRFSLNCGQTLTAHRYVYLKCAKQSNGKFRITADPCWTQTLPSTNDGYYYIRLGRTYSTYQMYLEEDHPIYYHDGTTLCIYRNPEEVVSFAELTGTPSDNSALNTILNKKAPLTSPTFDGTPKAPTAADGTNTTQIATTAFVQNAFKANDAMQFKGTIGDSGATVTSLPATHYQGWTYKVATAGTYAGQKCEVGDMIICITDGTSNNNAHWTIIQSNIDGAVTGPTNAIDSHVVTFSGTSGKIIKDSGFTIEKSVPANAKFTDTTYTAQTTSIGSASVGTAITADDIITWDAGKVPTLGTAIPADDITAWSTGTLPSTTVDNGVLKMSYGSLPSLSYTAKSIPNVTSVGSAPNLSYTTRIIPNITVTSKNVVIGISNS